MFNLLAAVRPLQQKETDAITLSDGVVVALRLRRNKAAKRLILRYDPTKQEVVVTLPHRVSEKQAYRFVAQQLSWIEAQVAKSGTVIELKPGILIPVEGLEYRIEHNPHQRGGALLTEDRLLLVAGPIEHLPRRSRDFLKKLAKARLTEKVKFYTGKLDVSYKRLTVRDTRSRWGSCAADGSLNFSWRLIMAPPFVLDYVVVHEVAHIREHNHSPAFWKIVAALEPDWKTARDWLQKNGHDLHRYQ